MWQFFSKVLKQFLTLVKFFKTFNSEYIWQGIQNIWSNFRDPAHIINMTKYSKLLKRFSGQWTKFLKHYISAVCTKQNYVQIFKTNIIKIFMQCTAILFFDNMDLCKYYQLRYKLKIIKRICAFFFLTYYNLILKKSNTLWSFLLSPKYWPRPSHPWSVFGGHWKWANLSQKALFWACLISQDNYLFCNY